MVQNTFIFSLCLCRMTFFCFLKKSPHCGNLFYPFITTHHINLSLGLNLYFNNSMLLVASLIYQAIAPFSNGQFISVFILVETIIATFYYFLSVKNLFLLVFWYAPIAPFYRMPCNRHQFLACIFLKCFVLFRSIVPSLTLNIISGSSSSRLIL